MAYSKLRPFRVFLASQGIPGSPVLDRLRCGGGSQLRHQDPDDVEKENEVDL